MTHQKMNLGFVMIIVSVLCSGETQAQLSSDCTNTMITMSPCLNYITGNTSTPSSGCCTQLANVVRTSPECLCQAINSGGSSVGGLNINQTLALSLPGVCKVQTPSISSCNVSPPAIAPPASSPTESTKSSSDNPSGSGSKTVPTTDYGTSDGSSTKLSASLAFFVLLAALYASTFTTC